MSTRDPIAAHFARRFPTTSWTMVAAAAPDSRDSAAALSKLCEVYWFPVYAFIRHRGHPREEAEDLCQEFFATFLQQGALASARPERGEFRSLLLASVTNFLANQWDRERALKRAVAVPCCLLILKPAKPVPPGSMLRVDTRSPV